MTTDKTKNDPTTQAIPWTGLLPPKAEEVDGRPTPVVRRRRLTLEESGLHAWYHGVPLSVTKGWCRVCELEGD
jgi:hypothetical protein